MCKLDWKPNGNFEISNSNPNGFEMARKVKRKQETVG